MKMMSTPGAAWRDQGTRWLVVVVVAIAVMLIDIDGLAAYPNFIVGTIAATAIAAVSLNLLTGYGGMFSLATPAFMATGAYGAAIILQHTPLGVIGSIVIPVVISVAVGGLLGLLALRLRGFYLALATLGVLEVAQYILIQGGSLFGNGYGYPMPTTTIGGVNISLAYWSGISVAVLVVVAAGSWSIRKSAIGRALALLRHHEVVAGCTGMNVIRLKVAAFSASAGLGALAGVLFGFAQGVVSPDQYSLTVAVSLLAYIVFGGIGSTAGAIIGTTLLLLLPQIFSSLGQDQAIINAAVLLGVVLIAPKGIVPLVLDQARRVLPEQLLHRQPKPLVAEVSPAASRILKRARVGAGREAEPTPVAIKFHDVEVRYGGVVAVKDFSLEVRRGTVHGLIGPNGAGKSSAVGALFGLNRLSGGDIEINGKTMHRVGRSSPPWDVATAGIGRTFQTPVGGTGLTALESVQNGLFAGLRGDYARIGLRTAGVLEDERGAAELSRRALELVRFPSREYKPISDLTLGELRRVELARVLVGDPEVIVLDEPTSGMELADAEALFQLLRDLALMENRAILVVEHNVRLIFGYTDEVTVMNLGQVIANGAPDEISRNMAVKEAYLGVR